MAEFTRKTTSNGVVQYRNKTENKVVSHDDMESKFAAVKEELDIADEGTVIDSDTITQGEGDGVTDADGNPINDVKGQRNADNAEQTGNEESDQDNKDPVETNPYRRSVPASEEGMGFPRKKGKTVDVFDGKTPHTHVRTVEGFMVPLSEKSYNEKTDAEIYEKLVELKMI